MTDYLMADFRIGAAALGNLSAFYFYSYVFMQVPTGVLADRWGPRKLLTAGACVASLGAFLFAAAPTILVANIGRLLIGGSVGVAWVSVLKLSTGWFPSRRFALTSGLALLCGLLGAVSAGVPLRILVNHFGWRPVMFFSAVGALVIAISLWIIVRDDPSERGYKSFAPSDRAESDRPWSILSGLSKVFRYKNTWLLTLAPGGIVGPVLAFSGLWGVPFFTTHYGLSPVKSAALTSTLLVAWGVGGPLLGGLSDRIGLRKPLYLSGCIISCVGWGLILFVQGLPVWLLTVLMIFVGLASGAMIIGFVFAKESVPSPLAGTVTGVCNMGVMMGPMLLQPVMGLVLDKNWSGVMENGIRIYDLGAYRAAFTLMMGWSILAIVLIAFTTETKCRQMDAG
jgi:MFS family permease